METPETRLKIANAIKDLQSQGKADQIPQLVSAYKIKYKSQQTTEPTIEQQRQERRDLGLPVAQNPNRVEPTFGGEIVRAPLKLGASILSGAGKAIGGLAGAITGNDEMLLKNDPTVPIKSDYLGDIHPLGFDKKGVNLKKGAGQLAELASYAVGGEVLGALPSIATQGFKGAGTQLLKQSVPLIKEGALAGGLGSGGVSMQEGNNFGKVAVDTLGGVLSGGVLAPVTALGFKGLGAGTRGIMNKLDPEIRQYQLKEKALKDLTNIEDNYSVLRKKQKYSKDGLHETRNMVLDSNILNDESLPNIIDETGSLKTDAAKSKYYNDYIGGREGVVRDNLDRLGIAVDPNTIENYLIKNAYDKKSGLSGKALQSAINNIKDEVAGYKLRANQDGLIPLTELHDAKINTTQGINFMTPADVKAYSKNLAKGLKEIVEKQTPKEQFDIQKVNNELKKHYQVIDYLEGLNGKKVQGGKLGKYFAQVSGNIIGGAVGSTMGPIGSATGTVIGGEVASRIKGNNMSRTFKGFTGKGLPKSKILQDAVNKAKSPRTAIAGSTENILGNTSSVKRITPDDYSYNLGNRNTIYNSPNTITKKVIPTVSNTTENKASQFTENIADKKALLPKNNYIETVSDPRSNQIYNDEYNQMFEKQQGRGQDKASVEILQDQLDNHIGKKLLRFVSNKEGELVEGAMSQQSADKIDNLMNSAENVSFREHYNGIDNAKDAINSYNELKAQLKLAREKSRESRVATKIVKDVTKKDETLLQKFLKPRDGFVATGFKNEGNLTTKILKDLEGKTTVSKQYILDATNRGELKQVERDLIRDILERETSGVTEKTPNVYWHGSVSGDLRGGLTGLHIGTKKAATEALEARIGVPAVGEWDGTREYGKTLLAGKKTQAKLKRGGTGINVDAPENDYYPTKKLKYGDGTETPMNVKPNIEPFKIKGGMTNSPQNPHPDFKANGYMAAQKKKGNAKNGFFYKNEAEDYGSISATVPDGSHLEKLKKGNDTINVKEFADKVKSELLPLKVKSTRTEQITRQQAVKKLKEKGISLEQDMDGGGYPVDENGEFLEYDDLDPATKKLLDTANGDADNYKDMVSGSTQYESVSLPSDIRGSVKNYFENIYESPIKTSAGNAHFGNKTENYFGHTRIEDMADNKTRRVIEVQSDLYQKGNLEKEFPKSFSTEEIEATLSKSELAKFKKAEADYGWAWDESPKNLKAQQSYKELSEKAQKILADKISQQKSRLQQYNDPTAHFRMIREEIKKAAQDGKTKLQFPTGETAMKIEGLGDTHNWQLGFDGKKLMNDDLNIGEVIYKKDFGSRGEEWIITDVLGDGKFKAVPKRWIDSAKKDTGRPDNVLFTQARNQGATEEFDISGKLDTNNPIYKFYEKDVQKYLNKYGGKKVIDDKVVSWIEIPITKEQGKAPVEAFGNILGGPLGAISGASALGTVGYGVVKANQEKKKVNLPKKR